MSVGQRHPQRWLYRGALLALGLALSKLMFPDRQPCVKTETLLDHPHINACDCFSETYLEARDRFRRAVQKARLELRRSIPVYLNYTMDTAFSPGGDHLIVHTSGVHGVEGYAGSAIQIAHINHMLPKQAKRPSILYIHAVNPVGMAEYRRVNEYNVDLNRNGIHDFDSVLARDPNVAHYQDFDAVFNPTDDTYFNFWLALLPKVLQHGLAKLKRAMVTGQYHHPRGIFYGGNKLEQSNNLLYTFVRDFLKQHNFTKVTWINVHTGLGPFGVDTMLTMQHKDNATRIQEIAKIFNESQIPSISGGDDVEKGYELMVGSTEQFVATLFDDTKSDNWLLSQEFGTLHNVFVGRALILENFIHHYGDSEQKANNQLLRDAFYPQSPKWRSSVLTRGLRVLEQAMARE